MPLNQIKIEKPSIKIFCSADVESRVIEEICFGIEEEGLPYEIFEEEGKDIFELSYGSCAASRLGVGIGVNRWEVAIQVDKLKKNRPLFLRKLTQDGQVRAENGEELSPRRIGTNAARFVKGMRLRLI